MAKKKQELNGVQKALYGTLLSYVKAGGTESDTKKLKMLQRYLSEMGFSTDLDALKFDIADIRSKLDGSRFNEEQEAALFTKGKKPRRYKYGSAFCPSCGMYKNYDKECPYCEFHEMGP